MEDLSFYDIGRLRDMLLLMSLIQLVVLACFFVLCANVASLKKRFCKIPNFEARFSMLIASGQKEEAQKLLFDVISQEPYFVETFTGSGKDINETRASFLKKYQPYFDMADIVFDFGKSDEFISKVQS